MRHLLVFIIVVLSLNTNAQKQKYTFVHFEDVFKDGVYITFSDFFNQLPVKRNQIIAMEDPHDPLFLLKILSYERFSYFDSLGNKLTVNSPDIWGIVRRNSLYVFHDYMLAKVHFNGRWGYFTTYDITAEPGVGLVPGSYYAVQVPLTAGKKTKTSIIDLKTGEIQDFKRKNLKLTMSIDSLLLEEYNSLRRRKQKQLKYLYLRKLNDRNSKEMEYNR